jgi:ribosome-binding protein aMBF1 (putative translation factor)
MVAVVRRSALSSKKDAARQSHIKDMSFETDCGIVSPMKDTPLGNVEKLGSTIRLKRKEKGLSQAAFATKLGVERKWVLRLEAGNHAAEIGLVLKALETLGIQAFLTDRNKAISSTGQHNASPSRLDEVFRRLERPGRK